jgi:hypothetical protein
VKKPEDKTVFLDSSRVLELIKDFDLNSFVEAAFAAESPTAVSLAKVVTPVPTDDYRMAWINVSCPVTYAKRAFSELRG